MRVFGGAITVVMCTLIPEKADGCTSAPSLKAGKCRVEMDVQPVKTPSSTTIKYSIERSIDDRPVHPDINCLGSFFTPDNGAKSMVWRVLQLLINSWPILAIMSEGSWT